MKDAVDVVYSAKQDQVVNYTGFIYSELSYFTVKLSCNINATHFPFDTQQCPVVLYPPLGITSAYETSWYLYY